MTQRKSELRFAGGTMAFRLESVTWLQPPPGESPESLVGATVTIEGPLLYVGVIRSVEPYTDPSLGPGHWVVVV
jgi:hypothetical protein